MVGLWGVVGVGDGLTFERVVEDVVVLVVLDVVVLVAVVVVVGVGVGVVDGGVGTGRSN